MASSSSTASPLRLTSNQAEKFNEAVRYILTEWPSLNFAIENGQGGSDAKQKQVWMCNHIYEVVVKGQDVDLEDYLAEIINQEFDTLIEDGSLEYNVQWISKFYKDCLQGKEQLVSDSINQAATKKHKFGNMRLPQPQREGRDSDEEEDEDHDGDNDTSQFDHGTHDDDDDDDMID